MTSVRTISVEASNEAVVLPPNPLNEAPSSIRSSPVSCGVHFMFGLYELTPMEAVRKILEERTISDITCREAFIVFSDTDNTYPRGGNALCSFIKRYKLGDIVEIGPKTNPNSGNYIKLWVWSPNYKPVPSGKSPLIPMKGRKLTRTDGGSSLFYMSGNDPRFSTTVDMATPFGLDEHIQAVEAEDQKEKPEKELPPGLRQA
jgi:hypothetical protein